MNVLGWACVVALGTILLGAGVAVAWFVVASVWGAWRDVRESAKYRRKLAREQAEDLDRRIAECAAGLPCRVHGGHACYCVPRVTMTLDELRGRKRPDMPWPEDEQT